MKVIRLILILSAFLIMVSAILSLLNGADVAQAQTVLKEPTQMDRTPIYLDLIVMFLLMSCIVLLSGVEKKMNKLKEKGNFEPKEEKFFTEGE